MKKFIFLVLFVSSVFPVFGIHPQRAPMWCWAAAVQDVLADRGAWVSQQQVAARLDGWPRNRPAHTEEVRMLLNSYGLRAWRAGRPGSPQELMNVLSRGSHLIAFINPGNAEVGHFVVLSGVDPRGFVFVEDPANGSQRWMPVQALYGMMGWRDAVVIP